jgi:hypothetical protein
MNFNFFLEKKIIICFVNVEIDSRLCGTSSLCFVLGGREREG